jgi:hypothetical protein
MKNSIDIAKQCLENTTRIDVDDYKLLDDQFIAQLHILSQQKQIKEIIPTDIYNVTMDFYEKRFLQVDTIITSQKTLKIIQEHFEKAFGTQSPNAKIYPIYSKKILVHNNFTDNLIALLPTKNSTGIITQPLPGTFPLMSGIDIIPKIVYPENIEFFKIIKPFNFVEDNNFINFIEI